MPHFGVEPEIFRSKRRCSNFAKLFKSSKFGQSGGVLVKKVCHLLCPVHCRNANRSITVNWLIFMIILLNCQDNHPKTSVTEHDCSGKWHALRSHFSERKEGSPKLELLSCKLLALCLI